MVTVQNTAYMHAREHFKISSSFSLVQLEAPFSCSFIRVSWFVLSIIALQLGKFPHCTLPVSVAPLYSQKKGGIKLMYQRPKTDPFAVH